MFSTNLFHAYFIIRPAGRTLRGEKSLFFLHSHRLKYRQLKNKTKQKQVDGEEASYEELPEKAEETKVRGNLQI